MNTAATDRERLDAATRALARAAERRAAIERLTVAAMEQESRELHDEHALMESSAGRKLFLKVRGGIVRGVRAARHPFWTAGSVARRAADRPSIRGASRALEYLRIRSSPLRLSSPIEERTDHPDDFPAIRWVGPIAIRSRAIESLLCHPHSSAVYRITAPAGSRFVTDVALSPHVWAHDPEPVRFHVTLQVPQLNWSQSAARVVDTRRVTARKWHPLSIALPQTTEPSLDVLVTLETTVDGRGNFAWALFGEPRFEWRRSAGDIRRSLATFAAQARENGIQGALALLRRAPTADEEAERYARGLAANTPSEAQLKTLAADAAALPLQPLVSVITPVYNTDPRWLRACVESVRRQVYSNWELCLCDDASTNPATVAALRELEGDPRIHIVRLAANEGISGASNAALSVARGEFVALLDHDDELTPDALARMVIALNEQPDADVLYSDEDKLDEAGRRCDACFKPDWSPELFAHRMYTCHFTMARRALVESAGRFRKGYEGAQDYDLWLRMIERTDRVVHVPRILYHWRKSAQSTASAGAAKPWAQDAGRLALQDHVARRGLDADVLPGAAQGLFRIRRRIHGRPLVSIVIPTAGKAREVRGRRHDLLAQAIRSIAERTEWPEWELVIVADATGLLDSSIGALRGVRHRVLALPADGPFNFSRKINAGVAASRGAHVLLFNDDLEAIERDWMTAMLEYSQDPAIGAVGAQLLYPDGRLQHVGMLMGVAGVAAHAYHQHPGTTQGYFGAVIGPRNYSAVTAACLMSRREVFDQVGGFDETFPIDFNDVDYCLRVRRAGYRIVYTPYARLYHHESASFGARQQDPAGAAEMQRRWADVIARDPYYNPNLTRDFPDFRLRT
jgi:GT2 family glycosyltransferase